MKTKRPRTTAEKIADRTALGLVLAALLVALAVGFIALVG